jgi:predicted nucleic acid-binding protein
VVVKILLDTSAYSALMRGQAEVAGRVRQAETVMLSTVVAGELLIEAKRRPGAA